MLPPSSVSKSKPWKPQATNSARCLLASLAYSSTLKTEVVGSSEMFVNFYQSKRRHLLEERNALIFRVNE
jgi:hypothetical protein